MTFGDNTVPDAFAQSSRRHPQTITVLLVVYHEERYIRDALQSIATVVDHIVVVHDGPCSDQTLSIASEFTDDILSTPERMGSAEFARPAALEKCTGDWVFVLDADERISEKLRDQLRTLVEDPNADSYGFAWPYVNQEGQAINRNSLSGKRFLFRRNKMYTVGLPHMTPDSYGNNISRSDLDVWHLMTQSDPFDQLRRMHEINRRRGRMTATILASGTMNVRSFNADLADRRVKNVRKIQLFVRHPLIALITVPTYGFLQRYFVRGYYRAGLIGLHDALNIPVFHAWTCIYRIRDRLTGKTGSL